MRYSLEKINAIKKLADRYSLNIGEILLKIWQSELRNSFSHSQYFWMGNTYRVSYTISPLSRKDEDIEKTIVFSEKEIEELYNAASIYLLTFIDAFNFAIQPYKDGNPHKVHDGFIIWTKYGWRWANK